MNLKKNEKTALEFSKLLIEKCPPQMLGQVKDFDRRAMASFTAAVNAYSNATGGEEHDVDTNAADSE